MNRTFFAIAALILLVASVNAQTITLVADVPFDFRVGDQTLPAGKYEVTTAPAHMKVQQALPGTKACMVLTRGSQSNVRKDPSLVFNKYGTEYFLSTVWAPGSFHGRAITPGKLEREVRNRTRNPGLTEIAAVVKH